MLQKWTLKYNLHQVVFIKGYNYANDYFSFLSALQTSVSLKYLCRDSKISNLFSWRTERCFFLGFALSCQKRSPDWSFLLLSDAALSFKGSLLCHGSSLLWHLPWMISSTYFTGKLNFLAIVLESSFMLHNLFFFFKCHEESKMNS